MSKPQVAPALLKPKAAAVWLVENTSLSFEQIADFTGLHSIEVQALADEDVGKGIIGERPRGLSDKEIERCNADPSARIKLEKGDDLPAIKVRAKGPKYTPVSRRGDKPDAIAWILKHHPEISDAQLCKLIGTTKPTITAVRDRTHTNSSTIKPRHPAELSLCSYAELEAASIKGLKAQGKDPEAVKAERQQKQQAEMKQQDDDRNSNDAYGGFDFSNFMARSRQKPSGGEE